MDSIREMDFVGAIDLPCDPTLQLKRIGTRPDAGPTGGSAAP